jgi:uncharacterized membrane protein YeiB
MINVAQAWNQAVNNPKTSKQGAVGFVIAVFASIGLVLYSLVFRKPIDAGVLAGFLTLIFTVLFHFVCLLLATDSKSAVVRIAAKLVPQSEVDNMASSVAKTTTDTIVQIAEELEKPKK